MAQIKRKFIANDAVDETKIQLNNDSFLQALNSSAASTDIIKLNASDKIVFGSLPQDATVPTADADLANKKYVDDRTINPEFEDITLDAFDITNQYVDLANSVQTDSIILSIYGAVQRPGVDYSIDYTGGAGGTTRITFLGDLATGGVSALEAGDVLSFNYAIFGAGTLNFTTDATFINRLTWQANGALQVTNGVDGARYITAAQDITTIGVVLLDGGPSGSGTTVRINKNGTLVGTVTVNGTGAGQKVKGTTTFSFSIAPSDDLTMDITQINASRDLSVVLY